MKNKRDFRGEIETIRMDMDNGRITYEEARVLAQPIITEMNERVAKIAKQFGKKPKAFTFNYLMR